jgi:hypothetical protein
MPVLVKPGYAPRRLAQGDPEMTCHLHDGWSIADYLPGENQPMPPPEADPRDDEPHDE